MLTVDISNILFRMLFNVYFNFQLTNTRSGLLYECRMLKKSGKIEKFFSDENGHYQLNLDTGTYTISYLPPNNLWEQSCLNELETYTLTLTSTSEDIENIDFANTILADCALMDVEINTPLQRRCFTNTYTVQYCNEGTETAEDAYVDMEAIQSGMDQNLEEPTNVADPMAAPPVADPTAGVGL